MSDPPQQQQPPPPPPKKSPPPPLKVPSSVRPKSYKKWKATVLQRPELRAGRPAGLQQLSIVHISDTHCVNYDAKNFPNADVMVHSGDFTNTGVREGSRQIWSFAQHYMSDTGPFAGKYRYRIVVCGNHERNCDWMPIAELQKMLNCDPADNPPEKADIERGGAGRNVLLCDSAFVVCGVKFFGSPWGDWGGAWSTKGIKSFEEEVAFWRRIPHDTDVLVTHTPPLGILDLAWERDGRFRPWGSSGLRYVLLEERTIPVHLFGHVHDDVGIVTIECSDTIFSNAAMDIFRQHNEIMIVGGSGPVTPAAVVPLPATRANEEDKIGSDKVQPVPPTPLMSEQADSESVVKQHPTIPQANMFLADVAKSQSMPDDLLSPHRAKAKGTRANGQAVCTWLQTPDLPAAGPLVVMIGDSDSTKDFLPSSYVVDLDLHDAKCSRIMSWRRLHPPQPNQLWSVEPTVAARNIFRLRSLKQPAPHGKASFLCAVPRSVEGGSKGGMVVKAFLSDCLDDSQSLWVIELAKAVTNSLVRFFYVKHAATSLNLRVGPHSVTLDDNASTMVQIFLPPEQQ